MKSSRRSTNRRTTAAVLASSAVALSFAFAPVVISSTPASAAKLSGSITVSAASSLSGVFAQLGQRFKSLHPSTFVAFNFDSSGTLANQIQQGAPADVFASASIKDMGIVMKAGDVAGPTSIFTRNTLAIVVKPGNPLRIHSPVDLLRAKVVALCATSAPCGQAAREVLAKSKVVIPTSKVSLGQDVKSTLAQVTSGDADAAIVYVTDARTVKSQGATVTIPAGENVITSYPIGLLEASTHRTLAKAWIAFVLGPIGQRALHNAGFLAAR